MPAVSEDSLPQTWRPVGVRLAGIVFGGTLLVVMLAAWFLFPGEVRAKFTFLQKLTMVLMVGAFLGAIYTLARSRVTAEVDRLVIVNGFKQRELPWEAVLAVHLPPGAPWAVFDLDDGTTASALAIQGSDGDRARQAVRRLRRLIDNR